MKQKLICNLRSHDTSYEIEIQNGLLFQQAPFLASLASRFAIITDDSITPLYGERLKKALSEAGLEVYLFSFPNGEQNKTRATKELLENQMFEKGLGRDTCVIALGGGVATDIAGYIAATYCRGIPFVMIPTSLLGMVDASIGGKTGVNSPYGKNMLGCIYQPKKICIDPTTLKTLPRHELSNGVVEMIKHALIMDARYFEYLEEQCEQLMALDFEVLGKAIFESCLIKKEIVEQDEKENDIRRLLNFGHTIGHALEKLSRFSLSHGEAVALGLLVESYLAVQLGYLKETTLDKLRKILAKYALPLRLPSHFTSEALLDAMQLDKKSIKGHPRFVMLEDIGSALTFENNYCRVIEESKLIKAFEWMNKNFYKPKEI